MHRRGVLGDDRPRQLRARPRGTRCVDAAHEPEVEEADAPVGAEQVVARVRVAGDEALVGEQAPEEAVDDLAEAVALGLAGAA